LSTYDLTEIFASCFILKVSKGQKAERKQQIIKKTSGGIIHTATQIPTLVPYKL